MENVITSTAGLRILWILYRHCVEKKRHQSLVRPAVRSDLRRHRQASRKPIAPACLQEVSCLARELPRKCALNYLPRVQYGGAFGQALVSGNQGSPDFLTN